MSNDNSRKLTSDEVNALMEGLSSGDITDQNSGVGSNLEVSPFAFGTDDLSLMGDYYVLDLSMKDLQDLQDLYFSQYSEYLLE